MDNWSNLYCLVCLTGIEMEGDPMNNSYEYNLKILHYYTYTEEIFPRKNASLWLLVIMLDKSIVEWISYKIGLSRSRNR